MIEIKSISDLIEVCKNVDIYGELLTVVELSKDHKDIEWLGGHRNPYDIKCDGKGIEVKSCNRDNPWATRTREKEDSSFESGYDHVNPEKFDYVVCVSFNGEFKEPAFYIFDKKETQKFRLSRFKPKPPKPKRDGTIVPPPILYNIEIRKYVGNEELNKIINDSKEAWHKLACGGSRGSP